MKAKSNTARFTENKPYQKKLRELQDILAPLEKRYANKQSVNIETLLEYRIKIAHLYLSNNKFSEALEHLNQSQEILNKIEQPTKPILAIQIMEYLADSYQNLAESASNVELLRAKASMYLNGSIEISLRQDQVSNNYYWSLILASLYTKRARYLSQNISINEAIVNQAVGDYTKSLNLWKEYQEVTGESYETSYKCGSAYYELGKLVFTTMPSSAIQYFNNALSQFEKALKHATPTQETLTIQNIFNCYSFLVAYYENTENSEHDYLKAIELLEIMVALTSDYEIKLNIYKSTAHAYLQLGLDDKTLVQLKIILDFTELHKHEKPLDFAKANHEMARVNNNQENYTLTINHCNLGIEYYQRAQAEDNAICARVEEAIQELRTIKAEMFVQLEKYTEASKIYDVLLKDEKYQTVRNYFQRGYCMDRRGQENEAIGAFRLALKKYKLTNEEEFIPQCILMHHTIAVFNLKNKKYADMEKHLQEVLGLFKKFQGIENQNVSDEVNENINRIVADSHFNLAKYYVSNHRINHPNIKEYFWLGLQNPTLQTAENYIEYANYIMRLGNHFDEAIAIFQTLITNETYHANPLLIKYCACTVAKLFLDNGELKNAEEYYLIALSQTSQPDVLLSTPEYATASTYTTQCIQIALGDIYFHQQQWDLALDQYQKSTIKQANTLYNQAICYLKQGQLDNAHQVIDDALIALDEEPNTTLSKASINTIKAQIIHAQGITLPPLAKVLFDELTSYYDKDSIRLSGSSIFRLIQAQGFIKSKDIDFSVKGQPHHEIAEKLHYRTCLQNPYLYQKKTAEGFSIDCFFKSDNHGLGFLTINNVSCNANGEFDQGSIRGIEDFFNKRLVTTDINPRESLKKDPAFFFHVLKHPAFTVDPALEQAMQEYDEPINTYKIAHLCASANKLLKNPITRDHVIHGLSHYNLYSKLFGINKDHPKEEALIQLNALIELSCPVKMARKVKKSPVFFKDATSGDNSPTTVICLSPTIR